MITDDKIYFRIKNAALDLDYLAKEVNNDSFPGKRVVEDSKRRAEIRALLAAATRSIALLQSKVGDVFIPEFGNNDTEQ